VPISIVEKSGKWIPGSRAMQKYIHLSDQDYKDEMLRQAGILSKDDKTYLQVVKCPYCGLPNPPTKKYCLRCKRGLNPLEHEAELKELYEERQNLLKRVDALEKQGKMLFE
jgi:uncharacterized OB-fold protein